MERQPTARLEPIDSTQSQHPSRCSREQTAEDNARAQASSLQRQQTEKRAEQSFYVDNDYFALNPWYDQEPGRPLFGLGRPFPRTVRRGMLWGRQGLRDAVYKVEGPKGPAEEEQGGQSERPESAVGPPASMNPAFLTRLPGKIDTKVGRLFRSR